MFKAVEALALRLPRVATATKYDGSPVLQVDGVFLAGLATHHSAEPDSLVIRAAPEDRVAMLAEAPETYYVTDYYRRHPVVLVRLPRVTPDILSGLLSASWRIAAAKMRASRPKSARPARG
ncbi:MAG: MmcQ/YjbR family DNA-binding protein [Bryobacterales bacterium]|nr:MmcQ/YjbR family DNA-binding protein [Bryobacterales bacterium]